MNDDLDARIEATTGMLLEAARADAEMLVTGDGRVSEASAAKLVGVADLKKLRATGDGPMAYKLGCGDGSRWSYKLADLASWIEARRE